MLLNLLADPLHENGKTRPGHHHGMVRPDYDLELPTLAIKVERVNVGPRWLLLKGLIRLVRPISEGLICDADTNGREVGMAEKCYW